MTALHRPSRMLGVAIVSALAFACAPALAQAADWLPHSPDATWTYEWTDSAYNPVPTREKVTVKSQKGPAFTLAWTTEDQGNAGDAPASIGTASFLDTNAGLVNTDWSSNPPPASFPVLCPRIAGCSNTLAASLHILVWGSRSPVLREPLLRHSTWASVGGAQSDVASSAEYLGVEQVSVPAFPEPVSAARVRSEITQAGAIGDPYGSGVRTVWWVYGVGPVKIVFQHKGGSGAPVTTVTLKATNLTPKPPPSDADWFPLVKGSKSTYRWTNTKHLKEPVVDRFTVDQVVNASARISVKSISGPIRVAGAYGFTARLDGTTMLWSTRQAISLAKLPPLGPRALPVKKRRHFFTPFDLMTFGFNPLLPAYPAAGATWASGAGDPDFDDYGVVGRSAIRGIERVHVPAGTFMALAVQTSLQQPGFPFGSGVRISWFAPDRGLVKLVFKHGDGSISRVELLSSSRT